MGLSWKGMQKPAGIAAVVGDGGHGTPYYTQNTMDGKHIIALPYSRTGPESIRLLGENNSSNAHCAAWDFQVGSRASSDVTSQRQRRVS